MSDLALPPDRVGSPEENKGETEVQEVSVVQGVDRLGGSTKSSWVEVATDKKALKRYDVEVSTKDGVHMIEIPDEILENSTPLWEDFVSLWLKSRKTSICVLQLVRRSKHIYGKRQVKNVSVQSLLRTDMLLELFLFTTSADCRIFRGNALVSEMQGLIFGDVFLTVFVSSHLSCGQLPLLQRFQRS
ncbi:hypothetical protein F2Q70_00017996 [Brassica cretica]|uniref:Uncharacterized protein n=1 Tax=Brassica cretica TaxID=69181 RepID=A0A8S9HWJ8_BRACR|nr:hypothetical protein F2Q70_00017996 [Brassica cretica]